jgi:Mn-containing catalase
MPQIRELLIDQMQDLLHAENQLLAAIPKMASAAQHPKLKEAFAKHLLQTHDQVARLQTAFEALGEQPEPKSCKGMAGLIEEGEETIQEGSEMEPLAADLALITAAQKVEHYEIAGYGTARTLALQIGEREVARLLSHTLGEEESTDHLLTEISKPLLQDAALEDMGANTGTLGKNGKGTKSTSAKTSVTPHSER